MFKVFKHKTRRYPMTWIPKRKLWKKRYRGESIEFPCRKMDWPLAKGESAPYMREAWKKKKAEIDGLIRPKKKGDQLLEKCQTAFLVVSAGIWRNKKKNACGLGGDAVAVHEVEDCLKELEDYFKKKAG